MNKILISIMLIASLMGCAAATGGFGNVEMRPGEAAAERLFEKGIGQPWVGGNPPWMQDGYSTPFNLYTSYQSIFSKYSQFYYVAPAPSSHISGIAKFEISGKEPSSLYFTGQPQAMPFSQYQTYSGFTGGNSLWIQGGTSWTQFAIVPQGASLSLLAISPAGGSGYLYEIRPDGTLFKNYYSLYQYTSMGFYADTVGQHILLFAIGDQISNSIVIDVVGGDTSTYSSSPYPSTPYPTTPYPTTPYVSAYTTTSSTYSSTYSP